MRILLLCHTFNSLSQRLYVELLADGHDLSVELDINDRVTEEAVKLWGPDLVIAPFMKRAIPAGVYENVRTLVVHPGIRGDRGPSALDHAILRHESHWGVTVIEATAVFDAGAVWGYEEFPTREARKSSLYRNEVTDGAVRAVRQAIENLANPSFHLQRNLLEDGSPNPLFRGSFHPVCAQIERRIDWNRDTTDVVVRKINSADGFPGTLDDSFGRALYLYNAFPEPDAAGLIKKSGRTHPLPGVIFASRDDAVCVATSDGAVWITHLRERDGIKLPAARLVPDLLGDVPELPGDIFDRSYREIRWEMIPLNDMDDAPQIALLHFDFYNGAMSTQQCKRLAGALRSIKSSGAKALVLMGSEDFFSNGINLNTIEASDSPADESLRNIEAMNDICREIIESTDCLTVSAMQGNAGAGGVFLALAADCVWARQGVVLNPHYRSMGNLYGSEYWTYLLPRRMDRDAGLALMHDRLPVSSDAAVRRGLIDDCFGATLGDFREEVIRRVKELVGSPRWEAMLNARRRRRMSDEEEKPLQHYRDEEIEKMKMNFYGFDPSYHIARYNFVYRVPVARTPLYLASHRRTVPVDPAG